jgi:hypothetical protein
LIILFLWPLKCTRIRKSFLAERKKVVMVNEDET